MRIEVTHRLKVVEVHARMRELGAYWQSKYGLEPTWTRDTAAVAGSFLGFQIDARLTIADHVVAVEGPDPSWLLRGRVTEYVVRKLGEYLDPHTSLEALARRRAQTEKNTDE